MVSLSELSRSLPERWPALAAQHQWRNLTIFPFVLTDTLPPLDQVQSVNMVPFQEDKVHIPITREGGIVLPGGTRERGESLEETLARELDEELGAVARSATLLGYWPCFSRDPQPWRPHLSHPDFLRVVFYGEVRLVKPPTNPDDGEYIARIMSLPPARAVSWLRASARPELADLHDLAATLRGGATC